MAYWIPTIEDYDQCIMDKLNNITVGGQAIHVSYYMPEHEGFNDLDLFRPAVLFFMYDQIHDITREHSIISNVVSETTDDIITKQTPTPMKFFYQFVILTDYKEHENEIIKQFNVLFPTRGYITLQSPNNEEVSYDFFQKQFMSSDAYLEVPNGGSSKQRLFRKIYKYHLYSEIDEFQEFTYKKVKETSTSIEEI